MKKAILFDLDGTLWHTSDVILPIWNEVLKKHPETQKQITLEEMNSYMGKTIEQIANIMLPELSEENGVNIIKECCAVEVPYLEKSGGHLYDNLEDVLSKLSEKYFLGIISNCQCGYIESFLKAHKLEKYFLILKCQAEPNSQKAKISALLLAEITLIVLSMLVTLSVIKQRQKTQRCRLYLPNTVLAIQKIPTTLFTVFPNF